ncbi:bifunctional 2-polyprenyl-6-hydroxyphenol methylase/3-demethylubiquinol 3-O-methyltransferase UbiG [Nonomuraea sp. NEAU-A123]|uniref:class I SAM-dependent methyltransferase n=1 Tax=Nonomuraea sp. NEAU-A123 TaxID=2839649 RepID=UPI001BE48CFF|nr:class I SAM-dependent methyltransferase [Nonomuraea sp. NEAU-A123]MBT2231286.1 methyltransferase domain-containing protein [Nonomuraea sp. NEAU-A123]
MDKTTKDRFAFGANWLSFLELVDEGRIDMAVTSLKEALGVSDLSGRTFLDIGCGSGLFSLAAHRLGARVHSFDFDAHSVAASAKLRSMFAPESAWIIERGSILDEAYTQSLGLHDVVYSWGVLHHTGAMWQAIEAASRLVAPNGLLYISIYNDQGLTSRLWWHVKRRYVQSGRISQRQFIRAFRAYFGLRGALARVVKRACGVEVPSAVRPRGMSARHDLIDWIGGFPFEVASPGEIFNVLRARGFELLYLKTLPGGHGCNEYVFARASDGPIC